MSRIRSFTPMINIQSTLRTAPDLCQNVSLAVLFGSNGSSYTFSRQSDMCVYVYIHIYIHTHTHTHILHNKENLAGQTKTNWDSSECYRPKKSFRVPFWALVQKL